MSGTLDKQTCRVPQTRQVARMHAPTAPDKYCPAAYRKQSEKVKNTPVERPLPLMLLSGMVEINPAQGS